MHLGKLYGEFDSRCKSLEKRANGILLKKTTISKWEFNYLTSTLVSSTWIHWSTFCRDLIMYSCQGTRARNTVKISPRANDNSSERIAYEASMVVKKNFNKLQPNGHINFPMWKEPTWGDLSKLVRIITELHPLNESTLLSNFGISTRLQDLQLVRNACAHKNCETLLKLQNLSLHYNFSKLQHPSELAWATLKSSSDTAFFYWLYEMNLIADYATSTN